MDIREIQYGSDEYAAACTIRELHLRKPLGLTLTQEDTRDEDKFTHFGVFNNGEIIGCVILIPLPGEFRLKQMLIIPDYQGTGIGAELLRRAETFCWDSGANRIILHAREYAAEFYRKYGYSIISDSFEEVGIPHYVMDKHRNPAG